MENKQLNKKLLVIQNCIEKIKKDGSNEFFKKPNGKASTYATLPNILSHVKPLLSEQGILITQPIVNGMVKTVLTDSESGESVFSEIQIQSGLNAQQVGSAITYYRRYTLSSLLSLEIDEDDDGNSASGNTVKPNAQATQKAEPDNGQKQWLNKWADKAQTKTTEQWDKVVDAIESGKFFIGDVEKKYKLSKAIKEELEAIIKNIHQ